MASSKYYYKMKAHAQDKMQTTEALRGIVLQKYNSLVDDIMSKKSLGVDNAVVISLFPEDVKVIIY